ncbi:MAG: UDP binding domain-containing protein, partial [Woeseiaceae bacterium]
DARVLVLGMAFKENCPDVRNTKVVDIVKELELFGMNVDVWDPLVDSGEAQREYGITLVDEPEAGSYDTVVIAVAHRQFTELGEAGIRSFGRSPSLVYDIKYVLSREASDERL